MEYFLVKETLSQYNFSICCVIIVPRNYAKKENENIRHIFITTCKAKHFFFWLLNYLISNTVLIAALLV